MAVSFLALSESDYCHRQAEECAWRAELAISPEVKTEFRQLEQLWLVSAKVGNERLRLPAAGLRVRGL